MNEEFFINQIIEIRLDTWPEGAISGIDLSGATSPRILYQKPNGESGFWVATIQGHELVYTTNSSDLDIPGTWRLQTFVTKSGGNKEGAIVFQTIQTPLS